MGLIESWRWMIKLWWKGWVLQRGLRLKSFGHENERKGGKKPFKRLLLIWSRWCKFETILHKFQGSRDVWHVAPYIIPTSEMFHQAHSVVSVQFPLLTWNTPSFPDEPQSGDHHLDQPGLVESRGYPYHDYSLSLLTSHMSALCWQWEMGSWWW